MPMPKRATVSCSIDYHPVALSFVIMKSLGKLDMLHVKLNNPANSDPLLFALLCKGSMVNAVSLALHTALGYLDNFINISTLTVSTSIVFFFVVCKLECRGRFDFYIEFMLS